MVVAMMIASADVDFDPGHKALEWVIAITVAVVLISLAAWMRERRQRRLREERRRRHEYYAWWERWDQTRVVRHPRQDIY